MKINQVGQIVADNCNCYYSIESILNEYGFIELITDSVEPVLELERYFKDLGIRYSKHYYYTNTISYTLIGDIATVLEKLGFDLDAFN